MMARRLRSTRRRCARRQTGQAVVARLGAKSFVVVPGKCDCPCVVVRLTPPGRHYTIAQSPHPPVRPRFIHGTHRPHHPGTTSHRLVGRPQASSHAPTRITAWVRRCLTRHGAIHVGCNVENAAYPGAGAPRPPALGAILMAGARHCPRHCWSAAPGGHHHALRWFAARAAWFGKRRPARYSRRPPAACAELDAGPAAARQLWPGHLRHNP